VQNQRYTRAGEGGKWKQNTQKGADHDAIKAWSLIIPLWQELSAGREKKDQGGPPKRERTRKKKSGGGKT